jgi:hypothetical protein
LSYDNVCKYLAEQYPVAFADWLLAIESQEVEVLKTDGAGGGAAWLDQQQPRAGEVNLIIRQLKRRLGEVEPVLIERVRRLPIVQLEALAEALLDFADMADLVGWLEQVQ